MNQEEKIPQEYKEIDLIDYIRVIKKRKWLIFILFLGGIILAIVFNRLSPKVYKINASLEIGKINDVLIEAPGELMGKIKGDFYGVVARERLKISGAQYPEIKTENLKDTNFVKLEIESSNPKLAQDILEEIDSLILEDHQIVFKNQKENLEKEIEFLESNMEILNKNMETIKNKIVLSESEKNNLEEQKKSLEAMKPWEKIDGQLTGSLFTFLNIKEKIIQTKQEINDLYLRNNVIEENINSSRKQINSLRGQIEDIKPTQVIKDPNIIETPIKPRSTFNITIAGILGIFVGTFLSFLIEWWDKNRLKI